MVAVLCSAWSALLAAPLPAERTPPEIELVRHVVAAVGPTTTRLRVDTGPAISALERDQIAGALRSTGLFSVGAEGAAIRLLVVRRDNATVEAVLERASGEKVWSAVLQWVRESHRGEAIPDALALAQYTRERLSLRQYTRTFWGSKAFIHQAVPAAMAPDPERKFSRERLPTTTVPQTGWEIVRGGQDILDDLSFAHQIGDNDLVRRIEEERFRARIVWASGFGGAAIVFGGVGAWLVATSGTVTRTHCDATAFWDVCQTRQERDDRFSWGISAVSLAVVSAVATAFFYRADPEHHIDAVDAQALADRYNADLRRELNVSTASD